MSTFVVASAADAAPVLVNNGPAFLQGFLLNNANAAARYLKLYDAATAAAVTVGTTLPKAVIPILPGTAAPGAAWATMLEAHFKLGIVYAIVTGIADNSAAAPSLRDVVGVISYDRA